MTRIKRSRRLQGGLAGLSVVGALGAAVGLGLTTHSHTSRSSLGTTGSTTHPRIASQGGGEGDDGSRSGSTGSSSTRQSPVTPPTNTAPQATTSGS